MKDMLNNKTMDPLWDPHLHFRSQELLPKSGRVLDESPDIFVYLLEIERSVIYQIVSILYEKFIIEFKINNGNHSWGQECPLCTRKTIRINSDPILSLNTYKCCISICVYVSTQNQ